jgi:hypothetical protein
MSPLKNIREDRYSAENLSAIEQLRWKNVLKDHALINNKWKKLFNPVPEGGLFYGVHKRWDKNHYVNLLVCFRVDEDSLGFDYLSEVSTSYNSVKFVRCLREDQLALFINSPSNDVREAIKKKLRGDKGFEPIALRQDLVDIYFSCELKTRRLCYSVEFCEEIIQSHFRYLMNKIPRKRYDTNPILTLSINGRVYVYQDRKFLIKPGTVNWIFSEADLSNEDIVDESHLKISQLSIAKKEG